MPKKIIVTVFIILSSFSNIYTIYSFDKVAENKEFVNTKIKIKEIKNRDIKKSKKELKKEIQKRKKFHKWLLAQYNQNFSQKKLDEITKNSIIISKLEKFKNNLNYN